MKPTTNRWLKLLLCLWAIVLIVILLTPSDLTYKQLKQINTSMTIPQVYQLLGEPTREWIDESENGPPGQNGQRVLVSKGDWHWRGLRVTINTGPDSPTSKQNVKWTGANHLLWIEYAKGKVDGIWLFPLTRTGGGLEGCIDAIRDQWNNLWK